MPTAAEQMLTCLEAATITLLIPSCFRCVSVFLTFNDFPKYKLFRKSGARLITRDEECLSDILFCL